MKRNQAIDALRFLCALLVILLHISAFYVVKEIENQNFDFWIANFIDSFARIAVPIFILISGKFLLERAESVTEFYHKRLKKIAIPLLFWSFVYSAYTLVAYRIFKNEWDAESVFYNLLHGVPHYHLWYLYMLIGLYFVTPIIRSMLAPLDLTSQTLVGCAFMLLGIVIDIWDRYHNNTQIFVLWFLPFLGYFILGHALPQKMVMNKLLCLFTCLLGICLTGWLTGFTTGWLRDNLYFYSYLSPTVVIASISLYLYFHKVKVSGELFSELAKHTLGIYVIHAGFVDLLKFSVFKERISDNIFLEIGGLFVLVLVPTVVCVYLINKIPILKKVI